MSWGVTFKETRVNNMQSKWIRKANLNMSWLTNVTAKMQFGADQLKHYNKIIAYRNSFEPIMLVYITSHYKFVQL